MILKKNVIVWAASLCFLMVVGCTPVCPESEPAAMASRVVVGKYTRVWDFAVADDDGAVMAGSADATPLVDSDYVLDAFVVKASASGQIQWTRSWDWGDEDEWTSIAPSGDGGYYMAGVTGASVIFPGYLLGHTDMILAKVDGDGQEVWSKVLRGARKVSVWSLCVNPDASFTVAGTESRNALLAKFDADGNELWRRTLDQSITLSCIATRDGGYAFCGQSGNGYRSVVKTDPEGASEWEFNDADTPAQRSTKAAAQEMIETWDDGYAVVGIDLDESIGGYRPYVFKLDSAGAFQWDAFGPGAPYAYGYGLVELPDGDLVAGGYAYSLGFIDIRTICDRFYGVRFSERGELQWSGRLGDIDAQAYSMRVNSAGQVVFAGTEFDGGDVIHTVTTDAGG
ncbi:MAG: hypothetical protein KF886_09520 [Candidatus Hydrogenedentes bacterium]|nr:hypothetical protein [Candidatus Hydrogenedentota bacterium]